VQLALTRNERTAISNLQVVVAEAGVERARAGFLPAVTLAGNDQRHLERVTPQNVSTSTFTINQPLVNASAWPLYAQARALADAQRAQNVDDKRLLTFSAAGAFFAVLTATRLRQAAERQLELAKANLAYTQARAEAGLTSSNDVTRGRHALLAARDFADEPLLRLVPTLGVQGAVSATTNAPVSSGRWNDEVVTATLTWTLYDAGLRYADKHSRDAQAKIAELTLQQLGRAVDAQVKSAVALLGSAQAALRVAEDAVTASRLSVDETAILYRQGLAKAIELVNANEARFTAEVNYATAQDAMAIAYLALRQTLGLEPLGTGLE
jgi:outer membrane protein TolC